MPDRKNLLVAVDDTAASSRMLAYVGRIASTGAILRIHLYSRLPALPPELREHGGSEDPEREEELSRILARRVEEWLSARKAERRTVLERDRDILVASGVPAESIELHTGAEASPGEHLSHALVRRARRHQCDTIVVGRERLSLLHDVFHRHAGDELVRDGEGLAIWVVA